MPAGCVFDGVGAGATKGKELPECPTSVDVLDAVNDAREEALHFIERIYGRIVCITVLMPAPRMEAPPTHGQKHPDPAGIPFTDSAAAPAPS